MEGDRNCGNSATQAESEHIQESFGKWISIGLESLEDEYPRLSIDAAEHFDKRMDVKRANRKGGTSKILAGAGFSLLVLTLLLGVIQWLKASVKIL